MFSAEKRLCGFDTKTSFVCLVNKKSFACLKKKIGFAYFIETTGFVCLILKFWIQKKSERIKYV